MTHIKPTYVKLLGVEAMPRHILLLHFATGEDKQFDVSPYIRGSWMGELDNAEYFNKVSVEPEFGDTVVWPNEQSIAPDELYAYSIAI